MPAYDVLLMADHGCYLWSDEPKLRGYRQPMERFAERLGVSSGLLVQLQTWHSDWEEMAYSNAGFATPAIEREWTDWHKPGGSRSARLP